VRGRDDVLKLPAMTDDLVILVDERDTPIGTAPRREVHGRDTPLHRAFSCFLFNDRGDVLLQQRAPTKTAWPSIWSNTCCGHPLPGEPLEAAVRRRLREELGLEAGELTLALADYRYRAEHRGVVENEICPVWIGRAVGEPRPDPSEAAAIMWLPWSRFVNGVRLSLDPFFFEMSPWCREEALLLAEGDELERMLAKTAPREAR
jgi:isopentenyl-diphosphate delta-isomerase type 1